PPPPGSGSNIPSSRNLQADTMKRTLIGVPGPASYGPPSSSDAVPAPPATSPSGPPTRPAGSGSAPPVPASMRSGPPPLSQSQVSKPPPPPGRASLPNVTAQSQPASQPPARTEPQ